MKRRIEEKLIDWKNRKRMPLLLYGARQVGKTYILTEFGSNHFENTVYVNFETDLKTAEYFKDNITPERLIRYLETMVNEEVIPGKTLIIFDEIQSCERALTSLKYFCENAPEYHIAAAGSLLGVAVKRENYSFPVGKVETMTLYPMDFEEFLQALGEERLIEYIRNCYFDMDPMPDALHSRALEHYRYYLIVGGMPAAVSKFADTGKLILIPNIQNEISGRYVADMAKYTTPVDVVKIRACYNSLPAQLAKENRKFQYKVVQKGGSAAIFGVSIDWLVQAGIALECRRVEHAYMPISVYMDMSAFKLYLSDIGLLTMQSGISHQVILMGDGSAFLGAIAENYIAQALVANGHKLYYWTSNHTAELDFVLQKDSDIIGCEVKKGLHTKSKSLGVFTLKYTPSYSIRFSEKNFGKREKLFSIPLYAAFCV